VGSSAKQIATALYCHHAKAVKPDPKAIQVGPPPSSSVNCIFEGKSYSVGAYDNQVDFEVALAIARGFVKAFGFKLHVGLGKWWMVALNNSNIKPGSSVGLSRNIRLALLAVGAEITQIG